MAIFWGSKKTALQIRQVKSQNKSILIFIVIDNIWAVQNEKENFGSEFKYASFQIVFVIVLILRFKFGETEICFTSCQILNFGVHQFKYIVEFEFEKSFSNLKSTINKSLERTPWRVTFRIDPKTKKQNLHVKRIEAFSFYKHALGRFFWIATPLRKFEGAKFQTSWFQYAICGYLAFVLSIKYFFSVLE